MTLKALENNKIYADVQHNFTLRHLAYKLRLFFILEKVGMKIIPENSASHSLLEVFLSGASKNNTEYVRTAMSIGFSTSEILS